MNGKALWVVLEAKPGKEAEVEKFLQAGQGLVEAEPKTVSWFFAKADFRLLILLQCRTLCCKACRERILLPWMNLRMN